MPVSFATFEHCTERAGMAGWLANTVGTIVTMLTGVKSFSGSNGSLAYKAGFAANAIVAISIV